jgi:hypothetical protein
VFEARRLGPALDLNERSLRPMTTSSAPDSDPMPEPPERPDLDACCGNGCDPCIFDLHDLAMDEHRQALHAWRIRNES